MKKGFTLIELLIVIGILAILATAAVLVLNPAQLLAQARDSTRIADLKTIYSALTLFLATASDITLTAGPFSNVTGSGVSCGFGTAVAPASPADDCAVRTIFLTDGTGWVAANLGNTSGGSPLVVLPKDPAPSTTYFYAFKANNTDKTFELNARLESEKYRGDMIDDGGNRNTCTNFNERTCFYEIGTKSGLNL